MNTSVSGIPLQGSQTLLFLLSGERRVCECKCYQQGCLSRTHGNRGARRAMAQFCQQAQLENQDIRLSPHHRRPTANRGGLDTGPERPSECRSKKQNISAGRLQNRRPKSVEWLCCETVSLSSPLHFLIFSLQIQTEKNRPRQLQLQT